MPTSADNTLTPEARAALLECFQEATHLVPVALRHQFVLVGDVASIAHSSRRKTEDVDVAASEEAQFAFTEAARVAPEFHVDSDDQLIKYDCRQGFAIKVKILRLGGPFVDLVSTLVPLERGYVASVPDLLVFRAVTVADRGKSGDAEDFQWLLERMLVRGGVLRELDVDLLDAMVDAAKELSWGERWALFALLSPTNFGIFL